MRNCGRRGRSRNLMLVANLRPKVVCPIVDLDSFLVSFCMCSWTRRVWRGRHPPPAAARRKPGRPGEARPPGGALREQRGLDDARRTRPVAPLFPQREGLLAFRLLLPAFLLLPRRPLCSQSQLTTGGCARPGARAAGVAGRDLAGMLADPKA